MRQPFGWLCRWCQSFQGDQWQQNLQFPNWMPASLWCGRKSERCLWFFYFYEWLYLKEEEREYGWEFVMKNPCWTQFLWKETTELPEFHCKLYPSHNHRCLSWRRHLPSRSISSIEIQFTKDWFNFWKRPDTWQLWIREKGEKQLRSRKGKEIEPKPPRASYWHQTTHYVRTEAVWGLALPIIWLPLSVRVR